MVDLVDKCELWVSPLAALAPLRVLAEISCKLISGTKAAISGLQPASKWFQDYNIIPGEENNVVRSSKEKAENTKGGDVAHAIYSNFQICKSVIAWQNSYLDPVSEGDDEYDDFDNDDDDDYANDED